MAVTSFYAGLLHSLLLSLAVLLPSVGCGYFLYPELCNVWRRKTRPSMKRARADVFAVCQVIHVTGRIRCRPALVPGSTRSGRRPMGLVALAHTLPPSTLNEVRMESQMFVFRVNMDLQVTYCENRYGFCPVCEELRRYTQ